MKGDKVLQATPQGGRSCLKEKTCPWKPEPWEGLPGTNLAAASCTSSGEASYSFKGGKVPPLFSATTFEFKGNVRAKLFGASDLESDSPALKTSSPSRGEPRENTG